MLMIYLLITINGNYSGANRYGVKTVFLSHLRIHFHDDIFSIHFQIQTRNGTLSSTLSGYPSRLIPS